MDSEGATELSPASADATASPAAAQEPAVVAVAASGVEQTSDGEAFLSGDEDFEAPQVEEKGTDLASAGGSGSAEGVVVEGSGVGEGKGGISGGVDPEALVSEGGGVGDVEAGEKIVLGDGGDTEGGDLGAVEAESPALGVVGTGDSGAGGEADGTAVEEGEVVVPAALGGGQVVEGGVGAEGFVDGGGGDDSVSLPPGVESGGLEKDGADAGVESKVGIPDKVDSLVEQEQVPLDALAVAGGENLQKEAESLDSASEVSGAREIGAGDQGVSLPGAQGADIADMVVEKEVVPGKVDSEVFIEGDRETSIADAQGGDNAGVTVEKELVPEKAEDEVFMDPTGGDSVADTGAEQEVDTGMVQESLKSEITEVPSGVDNGVMDNYVSESNQEPELDGTIDGGWRNGGVPNSEGSGRVVVLDSEESVRQLLRDLVEGGIVDPDAENSHDFLDEVDGQIATDSDEEADTDEENGKGFDSAALAALLRAASGASPDDNTTTSAPDASRIFSVNRPAGLGSSMPSLKPGPARAVRLAPSTSDIAVATEPEMNEQERALHEQVDQVRIKFLRLVHRLGHSADDTVAAQVLYRLGLAEGLKRGRQTARNFGIESAKRKALELEESGDEPLDYSCSILLIGKTGVGKSSIINSVLGEQFAETNAFTPSTKSVRAINGVVGGVKIRFLDTPGLRSSVMDQSYNKKILSSIKWHTKRYPPDIVLYVDRLDTQTRDFNDLPLLRSIANVLGPSIWFNAIVALTHAASAPPDGSNGTPLGYEVFVAQRSHVVQHSIRQAAGDMRLMNPVALVENHPSCRRNREGQRVLPNGTAWKALLLLLCYSSKTLTEANTLLKLQDSPSSKLFGFRMRSPPLPYLLSSLLQSRTYPKLPSDSGENLDFDVDIDDVDFSSSARAYDKLPPFKTLTRAELAKLTEKEKKLYFKEYDYRSKLLQKKQWHEEVQRLKKMRRRRKSGKAKPVRDDYDPDAPAAVPVPLPDMVLPHTFDSETPAYRYRFLEPTSQLLARPVLDTHGWDHDCGYDGVSLEENLAVLSRFPAAFALQITKDKKDFNIHLDSSIAAKYGESGASLAGFDIQSVGRQLAYILRGETKFNVKKNKAGAGVSVTFLGENMITGIKAEDQVVVKKRLCLVGSTGAVRSQGDVAYGANLEARLRPKDYPIDQELCTLGLSLMKWRRDLALGGNFQSQVSLGQNSKMVFRLGLNNKLTGQFTVRTSTTEQLQIALVAVIPIAMSIYRAIWPTESY